MPGSRVFRQPGRGAPGVTGQGVTQARCARVNRRSVVVYALIGLAAQLAFLAGAVALILAGTASQGSAITASSAAEQLELTNLTLRGDFLNAQQALRGYQVTSQDRFLVSYYTDRLQYAVALRDARDQAWPGSLPGLAAEARTAATAFGLADQSVAVPPASARGTALFQQAAAKSDRFVAQNYRMQRLLTAQRGYYAAASQRSLGIGLGASTGAFAVGLALPMLLAAFLLRRSILPLRATTTTVRRLAAGDHAARVASAGPAEIRELAMSINYLADESDRLRAVEEQRKRLREAIRDTAIRIREHLRTGAITRETVTDLRERLGCERVWVLLLRDGRVTVPEGNIFEAGLAAVLERNAQAVNEYAASAVRLYRRRGSLAIDLRSGEEAAFPADVRSALLAAGGVHLLLVPFGAATELLGILGLLRNDPGRPWTPMETAEIESLAGDIGRGLDHARMYQEEERLVEELRDLDRAKAGFLASATHDVQTPLTSIIGYVEMFQDGDLGPVTPPQAQALAAVKRSTRRLRSLIEDMLTMSRIEMGVFRSDLRPVDLARLVPEAVEAIRPAALDKGLALEVACADSGLMVDGDADQLDRVLTNLLSNAVKYTPPGGRVTLDATSEGAGAVVCVTDTGMGISAKDQRSLFTPFFRASNAVASSIPGSGLGLSIVRTIIENHHGDICLRSAPDEGTIVTIRIPLLGQDRAADGTRPAGTRPAGTRPAGTRPAGLAADEPVIGAREPRGGYAGRQ
jgi:two-component system, OmpR family, phosphate regulon sensor histidine kinase PhoR